MTDGKGPVGPGRKEETPAQRRRRLDAIFGDVFPDTTSDERDPGARGGDRGDGEESPSDTWLREQVPPHHG